MAGTLQEYDFNKILKNVAERCGLIKWHYCFDNFESVGQNYFGVLVPINIIGTDTNEKEVSIRVVLKLAPTDKRYRVSDAITRFFDREIFVYSVVLGKYQEIQGKLSTTHYIMPTCYYTCKDYCEEVIIMQDMRGEGFVPHPEGNVLDMDHVVLSVKALARFHALSFILKNEDTKLYTEIEQKCVPLNEITDKRFFDVVSDRLIKALEKFAHSDYVPMLTRLKDNCAKYIRQAAESTNETCICHADIWKENILFKYQGSKPTEACIIDYQTTRMCSPAFDILYLIISSSDSDLRHKHFKQLLDEYYLAFDEFLNSAGYDSTVIYSREAFDSDLKVAGPAVFIVANTAMWLSNGLQQEGHVRSKKMLTTDDEKSNAVQKYKSIVKSMIDDLSNYGYLCVC